MRYTVTVLIAANLALAGCSSSGSSDDKPAPTPTSAVTSSAPVAPPSVDQITACADAIAAGKSQDGPECAGLSPDDLLAAVQAANRRGRDALQSALDNATSQP